MRENIMRRLEAADSISRQLGLDNFPDDTFAWWPEHMRNDLRKGRENAAQARRAQNPRRAHA